MDNQNMNPTQQPVAAPPKKPWYKKWWIWVIIGVVSTTAIYSVALATGNVETTGKSKTTIPSVTVSSSKVEKKTASKAESKEESKTEKPTEAPTKNAEEEKTAFINSCGTIDFKTLARNPDKYKGNNYKFTGKVIQVLDSDSWFDNSTTLRINITAEANEFADGGYLWNDTIVATVTIPEGADRILEDDIIDFYGTCAGLYSYTSVLGEKISLPQIDIKYYGIHE